MNTKTETKRSAQAWKRKTAMAIGRPDLAEAPDEQLEAEHDAHMEKVLEIANAFPTDPQSSLIRNGMPPGPASVANESSNTRTALALSLVNEKVSHGMNYDDAFNQVLKTRPDLFQTKTVVHR
jgi:hypothetical protein